MPIDVAQLSNLASTPESGGVPPGDRTSMPAMQQAMPQGAGQPTASQPEDEDAKMEKVAALFEQMVATAHELMTVAPQTTPIIRDGLKKMYLNISDLFGMGDEAKLGMKKGTNQVQSQGMQQMGNL